MAENNKDVFNMKNIFKKPDPVHIMKANEIGDAIFAEKPELHWEIYEAVARRIAANYEYNRNQFVFPKRVQEE